MTGTGEVIDNYLVWELCKQQGIRKAVIEGSRDGEKIREEIVEKVRQEYRDENYDLDGKMEQVQQISSNPEHMSKMFRYCSWTEETVNIEELGTTLPHAMDLPPEVITGSLPEVAEFVEQADPKEYRSVKYINSLKQVPEVLAEFPTTAISPGKLIRRQERIKKAHGDRNWNIEETWGAVHDSNHRTIAKILVQDLEEIKCYVGHPSTDKIYNHVEL